MLHGDSKSIAYGLDLARLMGGRIEPDFAGVGGLTVATLKDQIDADLASRTQSDYRYVLITIGANDMSALPAEAQWNADLAYVLDAIHTKWPTARVGVALPWRRGEAADSDTLAARIASVVAARSWAFVGPDERIYLENGDDGVAYTADGIHPKTPQGYALAAAKWAERLPPIN